MNLDFQRLMKTATRLTRVGDLRSATAAIQAALTGKATPQASAPAASAIDVPSRELPMSAPAQRGDTIDTSRTDGAGTFIAGHYANAADTRDYKLYIPPTAGERRMPLVVMLHGCAQNPDDFAAGTGMNDAARAQGFYVLYPAQSPRANPQRCWNWFKHSHQQRDRGEPALLAGMTREVMARHSIDPARVYVAGLSAGGAMAAILGETYPDLYAAVGVHSGLAAGAANDLPSALGAMQRGAGVASANASGIPTIVFHGDADATVHPGNGGHVVAASVAPGASVQSEQGVAEGGHRYTRHLHRTSEDGPVLAEHWVVHGAAHAWSGGSATGSYTDPRGPDATAEMLRFFMAQALQSARH